MPDNPEVEWPVSHVAGIIKAHVDAHNIGAVCSIWLRGRRLGVAMARPFAGMERRLIVLHCETALQKGG
jgi:hypothetical protein